MSLLNRLRGTEAPRISAHGFQAALHEWADGAAGFSRAIIISQFNITAAEEADFDMIKTIRDTASTTARRARFDKAFDSVLMLASDHDLSFYPTNASIVARLTEAAS